MFDAVDGAISRSSSTVLRPRALRAGRLLDRNRLRVDAAEFIRREKVRRVDLRLCRHGRDFVDYAQRYLDGQLPIDRLVTERYRLDEINEACDAMLTGSSGEA